MPTDPENPRRDLFRGSVHVLVLSVLAHSPRYGYAIQKQLQLLTGHHLTPGTLYPLLHRLEAQGLIHATLETTSARPRKWYELTPAGRQAFRKAAADWQGEIARIQAVVLPAVRRVANKNETRQTN